MSEWYDSQKKTASDFRKLLQECIEQANPRRETLTKTASGFIASGYMATRLISKVVEKFFYLQIFLKDC
jgi:hypothetical protein